MQWEYKQVFCPVQQEVKECNQAGAEGWELTGFAPTMYQSSQLTPPQPGFMMIFKRPKVSNGKPKDAEFNREQLLIS